MSDKKRLKPATDSTSSEDEERTFSRMKLPGEILSRVAFWTYKHYGESNYAAKTRIHLGAALRALAVPSRRED